MSSWAYFRIGLVARGLDHTRVELTVHFERNRILSQRCEHIEKVFRIESDHERFARVAAVFVPIVLDGTMVERIVHRTRKSMLRWLGRKGYLAEKEAAADEEPDGLERCQQMAPHYGQLVGLPSGAVGGCGAAVVFRSFLAALVVGGLGFCTAVVGAFIGQGGRAMQGRVV